MLLPVVDEGAWLAQEETGSNTEAQGASITTMFLTVFHSKSSISLVGQVLTNGAEIKRKAACKMNQNTCYIVGAGDFSSFVISPGGEDYLIAADGGYAHLLTLGLTPDAVIGDFDSLAKKPDHPNIVSLPKEKNETDMLAAIQYGLSFGYKVFHLYGGAGGRLDHTIANLQCLAFLSRQGAQGFLYADGTIWTAITDGELVLPAGSDGVVSVFAHSNEARGVFEMGLKFPLNDACLKNTDPLGVSNEFVGQEARISVKEGTLLIVFPEHAVHG